MKPSGPGAAGDGAGAGRGSDAEFAAGLDLERVPSPALVLRADRVAANLECLIGLAGGDLTRLRPHLKTTKSPAIWRLLLERGLTHFKCATAREARVLLELAAELDVPLDLLVAYPHVGPNLAAIAALAREHRGCAVSVLVEDPEAARDLPESLTAFVDLNSGMNRTGADLGDWRWFAAAETLGAAFRGLHFYEGHHTQPGADRRAACRERYEFVLDAVALLRDGGLGNFELITSGTPGFLHALEFFGEREVPGLHHRVSPGTVLLHDLQSEQANPGAGFAPAAAVLARVVSRPQARRVTCDAGTKSIAAEAGDPCAVALGRPGLTAMRPSEEHLPFEVETGPLPARGEVLWLWPRHVCPTVNLAEQAWWIDPPHAPRLIEVRARAHDAAMF